MYIYVAIYKQTLIASRNSQRLTIQRQVQFPLQKTNNENKVATLWFVSDFSFLVFIRRLERVCVRAFKTKTKFTVWCRIKRRRLQ